LLNSPNTSEIDVFQTEARLSAEDDRAVHYLSSLTAPALRQILYDQLLTPHLKTILSMPASGLDAMVDLERTNDLARLYRLFGLVPEGLPTLRRAMRTTITVRGRAINDASLGVGTSTEEPVAVKPEDEETSLTKAKTKVPPPTAGAQTLKVALKWVEEVLALKDKFDSVLRLAFQSDRELESGINEVTTSSLFIGLGI
jgi:cullin 3